MTTREIADRSLRTLRNLAETFNCFEALSRAQLRELGLTSSQFDVIATLGNTEGMTFKELGAKTLITKGTLTGVVDRLERDGLVERSIGQADRRMFIVQLTSRGIQLFEESFPAVVESTRQAFSGLSEQDMNALDQLLIKLRHSFSEHEPLAAQTVMHHLELTKV